MCISPEFPLWPVNVVCEAKASCMGMLLTSVGHCPIAIDPCPSVVHIHELWELQPARLVSENTYIPISCVGWAPTRNADYQE